MKKAVIVLISIVVVIVLFIYTYWSSIVPDFEPTYTVVELKSDASQESIYLKKKVWGISSDHQVIVISASGEVEFEAQESEEYLYKTSTPFLYEFKDDLLKVYTRRASPIPSNFDSSIKVEQVVLNNSDMLDLLDKHEEKGVKAFSR